MKCFIGKNILGWPTHNRVSSLFGDEKILGSYLARLWPIFFGLYIILFKKKNIFIKFLIFSNTKDNLQNTLLESLFKNESI